MSPTRSPLSHPGEAFWKGRKLSLAAFSPFSPQIFEKDSPRFQKIGRICYPFFFSQSLCSNRRRSFCDELCQLYDVILAYKTRCPTLFHTEHHQFSFIGNFHIFYHRNEIDHALVVFCGDLSFHWYIYRTLEIGTYEKSYRGLNLEDGQFFSITTLRWPFQIRCEYI